ncbi:DNA polymerase III subunit, partial [Patescibacteria group bacterium]|nr:DNA polymerase III subunit [Patescibacteria group bacterium]
VVASPLLCYNSVVMQDSFQGIVGHKKQLEYLRRILKNQTFAHAFCFSGISKIGKRTTAIHMAAELLGILPEDVVKHPNIILVEKPVDEKTGKQKKVIGVEQVRDITSRISMSTFDGNIKIAIINDADAMNNVAQNALLKTLEEPSGRTLIILISKSEKALLPTILSRTVHIRFSPVASEHFKSLELDEDMLQLVQGRPGIYFDLQKQDSASELRERLQQGRVFLKSPLFARFAFISSLTKQKDTELIWEAIYTWRYLIRNAMHKTAGTKIAKHLSKALQSLEEAENSIKQNGNPTLALEHFALSL